MLSGAIRRTDYLARVSTDGLTAVLVGCKGPDGALAFLGRFERSLERAAAGRPAALQLSYGIQRLADADSPQQALELAEISAQSAPARRTARRWARPRQGERVSTDPLIGAIAGPGSGPPLSGAGRDARPRSAAPAGASCRDILVELGFVDRPRPSEAVEAARHPGQTPEKVMLEGGTITEDQLARAPRRALRARAHRPDRVPGGRLRRRAAAEDRRQALPRGARWLRRRRRAGARGGRPGRLARAQRHRRDDQAAGAAGGVGSQPDREAARHDVVHGGARSRRKPGGEHGDRAARRRGRGRAGRGRPAEPVEVPAAPGRRGHRARAVAPARGARHGARWPATRRWRSSPRMASSRPPRPSASARRRCRRCASSTSATSRRPRRPPRRRSAPSARARSRRCPRVRAKHDEELEAERAKRVEEVEAERERTAAAIDAERERNHKELEALRAPDRGAGDRARRGRGGPRAGRVGPARRYRASRGARARARRGPRAARAHGGRRPARRGRQGRPRRAARRERAPGAGSRAHRARAARRDRVAGPRSSRCAPSYPSRARSSSSPASVVLVADAISTSVNSPAAATPVKFTVLLCRVRPRSLDGSVREAPRRARPWCGPRSAARARWRAAARPPRAGPCARSPRRVGPGRAAWRPRSHAAASR